ncbi:hypothetical protein CPB83DRAFT_899202 [Crepidotus variabilis]|uniref:F-box domain-containing protein n=1 Tax=Crepidotus variabilis TaxID=179855 RepID=A0A9P6E5L6_9AGAR|nr:hypothetical protein CPB83DRAFT_899202 [Crepidotus variabilis]
MTSFLDLPDDLRVEISEHMDYVSVLRLSSCCKSLQSTVSGSSALQYKIALGLNFMTDGGSQMSLAELLALLNDRWSAWQKLQWKSETVIKIPGLCNAYELVAGVFAMSGAGALTVVRLPSTYGGKLQIVKQELEIPIRDFAIDPTQDLVAILEDNQIALPWNQHRIVQLHFRSVSSNKPHSNAALPFVTFEVMADAFTNNRIFSAEMQLADCLVSVFLCRGRASHAPRALVWNWKTGALIYDSNANNPIGWPNSIHDFSFIDANSFVCTSRDKSGQIHIYTFPESPKHRATYIGTLNLPDIFSMRKVFGLTVHSSPYHANAPLHAPFTPSDDGIVHCFSVLYVNKNDDAPQDLTRYNMFIRRSTLLKFVQEHKQKGQCIIHSWDSWGPANCRFLPRSDPRTWLRYIHGHRFVRASMDTDGVDVLEFNTETKSSLLPCESDGLRQHHGRDKPTIINRNDVFCGDVVSSLPYQVLSRAIPENFYAYMIDQEHVIGLKVRKHRS